MWKAQALWDKKTNNLHIINQGSRDETLYLKVLEHLYFGRFKIINVTIKECLSKKTPKEKKSKKPLKK